ncbi:hypothetical protein ABEF95_002504 [Exophiala dermatitidis]
MAPHSTVEEAASLQTLSIDSKDGLSPREKVFVYQHLPQISDTMIESYDRDFVQVMQGMDIKWEKMPSPLDFQAWREYDRTEYHNYDREVHCKRTRTKVPVTVTTVRVSYGENNEFGIHVFEPQHEDAGARPAVLMYHGGGWSHGDPNIDAELSKFFASELRAVVFGVDYRLAPEHNILTIHEDAYQALEWVIKNAEKYSIDSGRIALWGCSAGGHLAATVAMRDAKEHNPSRLSQVNLVVPALCHIDAYDEVLKAVVLAKLKVYVPTQQDEAIQFLRYVFAVMAQALPPDHPVVSPLCHPDPLPEHHAPTHFSVAGCDILLHEGIAYATKLRNAGIDTMVEVLPGVPHGFTMAVKAKATLNWTRNQVRVLEAGLRK